MFLLRINFYLLFLKLVFGYGYFLFRFGMILFDASANVFPIVTVLNVLIVDPLLVLLLKTKLLFKERLPTDI